MKTPFENASFYDRERETKSWAERLQVLNTRFLDTLRHAYAHSSAYRGTV